jgi:hypothetical protein
MHGPHEPAWDFYRDQLDFVARNNWIFQTGIPRMDIAIWQKMTVYPGHIEARTYEPTDLEEKGYSYEYISPDNLQLPAAKVINGILAPDAQAFKVFVVRANDSLTLDGVTKLIEFANAGLQIVLAGGVPSTVLGTLPPIVLRQVQRDLAAMASLQNVHVTDSYLVASTIASLSIQPLTKISTNASWYTYWRSDPVTNIDYVFVYNDAMYSPPGEGASEGAIEFQSTKRPYIYNTWTGDKKPVLSYTTTNISTTIPFNLAGNQSIVVAFLPPSGEVTNRSTRLTSASDGILDVTLTNGSLSLKVSGNATYSTSTGFTKTVSAPLSSPIVLSNWTLVVEHWEPPDDLYNYTSGAVKYNTTHHLPSLVPWIEIPGLQNVSGRGYYFTTFAWPPPSFNSTLAPDGAFVSFGPIYHTLRASINGHSLPPLDVTDAQANIGPYLVKGVNKVEAVVATPLGNVLRPIWFQLMSSGESPGSADAGPGKGFVEPPQGAYGLIADVIMTPYWEVEVGE